MRHFLVLLALVVSSAVAHAQGAPPMPPPPGGGAPSTVPGAPVSNLWVGAGGELMPAGSFNTTTAGTTASGDTATAFGLVGLLDYQLSPVLSVGLAPRYVLNVKGSTDNESGSMLDLRAYASAGTMISPQARLFAMGGLGYSIIYLPTNGATDVPNPAGLTLTLGGGIAYAMNPRLVVLATASYEFGFQSVSEGGVETDLKLDYLSLGLGAMIPIGG